MSKNIVFIDNTEECWVGDMDVYTNSIDYVWVPTTSHNKEKQYTKHLAKLCNQYAKRFLMRNAPNFVNNGIDRKIANRLKKWSSMPTNRNTHCLTGMERFLLRKGFLWKYSIGQNQKHIKDE